MSDVLGPLPAPTDPFTLLLVAAVAASRALDFLSTWIVTPRLALEANALMRRSGWARMALLNLPLPALPLLHHGAAIALVVLSLLAAGTNLSAGVLARGMSEAGQLERQRQALRRLGLGGALLMNSVGSLLVCLGGAVIVFLAPAVESPAGWAGLGVVLFGASGLVHLNWAIVRLHGRRR